MSVLWHGNAGPVAHGSQNSIVTVCSGDLGELVNTRHRGVAFSTCVGQQTDANRKECPGDSALAGVRGDGTACAGKNHDSSMHADGSHGDTVRVCFGSKIKECASKNHNGFVCVNGSCGKSASVCANSGDTILANKRWPKLQLGCNCPDTCARPCKVKFDTKITGDIQNKRACAGKGHSSSACTDRGVASRRMSFIPLALPHLQAKVMTALCAPAKAMASWMSQCACVMALAAPRLLTKAEIALCAPTEAMASQHACVLALVLHMKMAGQWAMRNPQKLLLLVVSLVEG